MNIEWEIKKKAGNLRPRLHYRLALESFEIDLAVPMVRIISTIPKPADPWQGHVWPGTLERGRKPPEGVYELSSPSHKTGFSQAVLALPMRPDNSYPEVEESFLLLRCAYERALADAYANSAFETRGELEMSPEVRKRTAPAAAAARFLQVLGLAS